MREKNKMKKIEEEKREKIDKNYHVLFEETHDRMK